MGWQSLSEKLQLFANWNWKSLEKKEGKGSRRGRGGRVSISSRWSYWSMGARARTSIHTWIHGNGPSWSMLVMVNYHVSRTPTSPSSRLCPFDSLSQICTAKLFWLLYSDLAVQFLSLSLFFLFYSFRPFLDRSFFAFFDSFARALLSDFVIALIIRFFIEGGGERGKIKSIFVDLLFFFSKLSSSQTRNTWHFSKNWNFIYAKRPRGK